MATLVNLEYDISDIIGTDFRARQTRVYVLPNTPVVVVDGDEVRFGDSTQTPADDGTGTFTGLIATNSASNPTTFAYRFAIDFVRSSTNKRETWTSAEFPLIASANLAAIPEAFDDLALPVAWRSDFRDEMEALRDESAASAALADSYIVADLNTSDGQMEALIESPTSLTAVALSATIAAQVYRVAAPTGVAATDRAAILAAFDAAEAAGGGHKIVLGRGRYNVGAGLSLAGYSSTLVGQGAHHIGGTVLYATAQTGPVVNLDGWIYPENFYGSPEFSDFVIEGDGTGDTTPGLFNKVKEGLRLKNVMSTTFRNMYIWKTGGSALALRTESDLNIFENVVMGKPVANDVNDVPYWLLYGIITGNTFRNCGMRAVSGAPEGASGSLVILDDGVGVPSQNVFDLCWAEFLHVQSGSQIVLNGGTLNEFRSWQWHDCDRINLAATDTAYIRLVDSAVANNGGNQVTGHIMGDGANANTAGDRYTIHRGVVIHQRRNHVKGIKGDLGGNVELRAGVQWTTVELAGAFSSAGGGMPAGIIDNSGTETNVLIDHEHQTIKVGATMLSYGGFRGGAGWRIKHTAGVGNPTLMLENSTGKHHEIRIDEATNELIFDYWSGSARSQGVVKIGTDGTVTLGAGAAYLAKSPDGTLYRLAPPNGGGAVTWVTA